MTIWKVRARPRWQTALGSGLFWSCFVAGGVLYTQAPELSVRPWSEWLARFEAAGVPCGPVNDVAALLRDPQVAARNMLIREEGAGGSEIALAGNPIKLSGFEDPDARDAAPELDADRDAILKEFVV